MLSLGYVEHAVYTALCSVPAQDMFYYFRSGQRVFFFFFTEKVNNFVADYNV